MEFISWREANPISSPSKCLRKRLSQTPLDEWKLILFWECLYCFTLLFKTCFIYFFGKFSLLLIFDIYESCNWYELRLFRVCFIFFIWGCKSRNHIFEQHYKLFTVPVLFKLKLGVSEYTQTYALAVLCGSSHGLMDIHRCALLFKGRCCFHTMVWNSVFTPWLWQHITGPRQQAVLRVL